MKIGLIAMSGIRVRTPELAELGVTLPQFVNRGKVVASLPSLGLLTVAALTPDDPSAVSCTIIAEIWVAFSQNLSDNLADRRSRSRRPLARC